MIDYEEGKDTCEFPKGLVGKINRCLKGEREPMNVYWNSEGGIIRIYGGSLEQKERLIDNLSQVEGIDVLDNPTFGTLDIFKARA